MKQAMNSARMSTRIDGGEIFDRSELLAEENVGYWQKAPIGRHAEHVACG